MEPSVTAHQVGEDPGSILRRFYAMSQRPNCVGFMKGLWRQAWPQELWSDVFCGGLSHAFDDGYHTWHIPLSFDIEFQISSDERLQLPVGLAG